jgi:hypothetical protein
VKNEKGKNVNDMRQYCIWRFGSTGEDGNSSRPTRCVNLNCSGEIRTNKFRRAKDVCENFRPDIPTIFSKGERELNEK